MLKSVLWFRAKLAYLWRLGIINRTTAFHWEMDAALGELTWKVRK
jgi:hypothetical protein